MSEATLFLTQLWGPILLALGVGIYLSPSYYTKVYKNLESETLAVMVAGIAILAVGILQIMYHNVWGTLPEILMSLFGWASAIKGVTLLVYPKLADKFGDQVGNSRFFSVAAPIAILLGGYITYVGYIA